MVADSFRLRNRQLLVAAKRYRQPLDRYNMALTKFQRLMLMNAQPIKFWLNIIGGLIAIYFLWKHELINAMIFGGIIILTGTFFATKYSKLTPEEIAKTKIGGIFLRYSTKFGLTCYLISHILIPTAFWYHNLILLGVGLLFLITGLTKT